MCTIRELPNPFCIYSVDASEIWVKCFNERFKKQPLLDLINLSHSKCTIGEINRMQIDYSLGNDYFDKLKEFSEKVHINA